MIRLFFRIMMLGLNLAAGALLAVWAMRKLQALHPDHLARRAAGGAVGLLEQAREFADDVLEAAAEHEVELRARLEVGRVEHGSAAGRRSGRGA
ncbi:hypothetical protein [Sinosporangium siamense]|uniref:Uncharacterized protein n=1 Tax=Sinosporangium siamense TaxID=1367973 RepID=A0A919V9H6_9ACTN|nr:hypothetical protein [Sinosporangium siamense]GII95311.1 hypothetical protein Ssi02_55420 [Sinosporangium siamense]